MQILWRVYYQFYDNINMYMYIFPYASDFP